MVIVFETTKERDVHPRGGQTFKEVYGKSWPEIEKEIRNNPHAFKMWAMYVGADSSMYHNLRSHSRSSDPLYLPANDWVPVEYRTVRENGPYRWVGRTTYTPHGGRGPEEQYIDDVKFLLKYRKRDIRVSLDDPHKDKELSAVSNIDKRKLIGGINPLVNENALNKQDIIDAINDRFGKDYQYRDHTKAEFLEMWLKLNDEELEKELN